MQHGSDPPKRLSLREEIGAHPILLNQGSQVTYAYISDTAGPKSFPSKPKDLQKLINEAIHLLSARGLPIKGGTGRRLERTAMAFLAVLNLSASGHWMAAKHLKTPRKLPTREIVRYWREHFGENVSDGSYDDIRRIVPARSLLSGGLYWPNSWQNAQPCLSTSQPSQTKPHTGGFRLTSLGRRRFG